MLCKLIVNSSRNIPDIPVPVHFWSAVTLEAVSPQLVIFDYWDNKSVLQWSWHHRLLQKWFFKFMGFFFFVLQSFKLLGFLDVKNVPCARESVLYGSLGSLVMGLGHFLATSKYSFWVLHIYLQEKSNFYLLLGVINSGKSYKLFNFSEDSCFSFR